MANSSTCSPAIGTTCTNAPFAGSDGRTVRVQIAADITDKKHIDEVNLQQQKRLEQTSRLITMGEMASSLAHELNQPLSAIANYCAGCVKRMQAGNYRFEDLLAAMQKAGEQAERAGKIIRRMRDMVKKSDPNRLPVAAELIDETRAFADIEAQRTGTQIAVDARKFAENRGRPHHDRAGAAQSGQKRH
jgi:phosphoglycerate-specific signal transduction histidine kinase